MKNLRRFLPLLATTFILFACTAEIDEINSENDSQQSSQMDPCVNADPITRVVNNGTLSFDFQVIDNQGNIIIDIPNIPPNSTTSWSSFSEGEVLFSIFNNSPASLDDKVEIQMNTCMSYEMEIDANNEVVSYIPITL